MTLLYCPSPADEIYSRSRAVEEFNVEPFCKVANSHHPISPFTNISLSPSVKQASGSSDSSGSSSTESTPSPGGRISTVLPSDELRFWGSTSSFCANGEAHRIAKLLVGVLKQQQFINYWSQPSELVITVIFRSHVIQCHNSILALSKLTELGSLNSRSSFYHHHHHHHHMQH